MTVETNTIDKEYITQLSKKNNEPDWLLQLRLQALEQYQKLPIPHFDKTKIDKWNIDQFELAFPDSTVHRTEDLSVEVKAIIEESNEEISEDKSLIVIKESSVIYRRVAKELVDKGVIFTDLNKAIQDYPELIRKYFTNDKIAAENNKLTELNSAIWDGGLFLYIPQNVEVELPVQAIFAGEEGGLIPRILIVAERNSSLTYVDTYSGLKSETALVQNGIAEVYVGENARVRFVTIHSFEHGQFDYSYRRAYVERDGCIEWIIGEMNSCNTISNNTSYLIGSGAKADIKTIFVGTGDQRADLVSKVIHIGEHTESNILSHGVMLDEATGIFNGITKIEKGAIKSNAAQSEKILMLSSNARGYANPILLIDENDVAAGHAASAGPVDPNDIFYLMSRGITEKEAKRLIINGFLNPVVSKVPVAEMKEQLEKAIERKLKND